MRAMEAHVVVEEDGYIELGELPVKAGDRVKVIVLMSDEAAPSQRYPLRGAQPYRFDDPTSPIAPDDWEENS